jgi:hypothetical protein
MDAVFYPNEMAEDELASQMSYASNALCGIAFHEAGRCRRGAVLWPDGCRDRNSYDANGKIDTVGSVDDLPLIGRIAIHCAGQGFSNCFQVPQSDACFR